MEVTVNSNIKVFENPELGSIRMVEIDGEPWWVGKDVAKVLGYQDLKHCILDHIDEEDRINSKTRGQNNPEFGQRGTWLINESGLYSLILSSKIPEAKEFKHWVTSEVLPSIRKTGAYITQGSDTEQYISNLQNTVTELSLQLVEIHKELRILSGKKQIDMKIANIWKKQVVNHKMELLSSESGIDIKDCYKMVYDIMMGDYGFCEAAVINDFINHYDCENISTINIIASDKIYREWFVRSADKLIEYLAHPTQYHIQNENNGDQIADLDTNNTIDFPAHYIDGKISINDDYDNVVDYIAYLLGDHTKTKLLTKKYILPMISSEKGWKNAMTRNRCYTKKSLIIKNRLYKKRFVKVCNEIVNNFKYNN